MRNLLDRIFTQAFNKATTFYNWMHGRGWVGVPTNGGGPLPHVTRPVQVWADIDLGIAEMVEYLNTIPGVRTDASCQGTIGEGGPHPYRAQVLAHWTDEAAERLSAEFDMEVLGKNWGYLHPKESPVIAPPIRRTSRTALSWLGGNPYGED